jgi:hypothetical protein
MASQAGCCVQREPCVRGQIFAPTGARTSPKNTWVEYDPGSQPRGLIVLPQRRKLLFFVFSPLNRRAIIIHGLETIVQK